MSIMSVSMALRTPTLVISGIGTVQLNYSELACIASFIPFGLNFRTDGERTALPPTHRPPYLFLNQPSSMRKIFGNKRDMNGPKNRWG